MCAPLRKFYDQAVSTCIFSYLESLKAQFSFRLCVNSGEKMKRRNFRDSSMKRRVAVSMSRSVYNELPRGQGCIEIIIPAREAAAFSSSLRSITLTRLETFNGVCRGDGTVNSRSFAVLQPSTGKKTFACIFNWRVLRSRMYLNSYISAISVMAIRGGIFFFCFQTEVRSNAGGVRLQY